MANSCRLSPVVYRRNGIRLEEKESKLFKDIKNALKDNDLAWQIWAFTKTSVFKSKYKNLEYDELGEVTFPSLIKVLELEDAYNMEKDANSVASDYGVQDKVFSTSEDAINKINNINSKEKNHVAIVEKDSAGYTVKVLPRISTNVQKAKEQSYNHALTGEIISLLRSMGFDVSFVSDPKFEGLFDPRNAKLENGLLSIIQLAKGEVGELALPEEFSHLIIEGLISNPLVQRLLATLETPQIEEVLGSNYNDYYNKYNGDITRLKKEAAGKMLAQYISDRGTISKPVVQERRSLLSRIWNWVKSMFSKVNKNKVDNMKERAFMSIADIYNLVSMGDIVNLIDKASIMQSEELYKLSEKYRTIEQIANLGLTTNAKLVHLERMTSRSGKVSAEASKDYMNIKKAHEKSDIDSQVESIDLFLQNTGSRLAQLVEATKDLEERQKAIAANLTQKG